MGFPPCLHRCRRVRSAGRCHVSASARASARAARSRKRKQGRFRASASTTSLFCTGFACYPSSCNPSAAGSRAASSSRHPSARYQTCPGRCVLVCPLPWVCREPLSCCLLGLVKNTMSFAGAFPLRCDVGPGGAACAVPCRADSEVSFLSPQSPPNTSSPS